MNEYTDIQVLECNRLHSEEAKIGNNENTASWTVNLQDIVHLEPGDKVSVQGAMINEKGAGQSDNVEIKGVNLGYKKDFKSIEYTYGNINDNLPAGYDQIFISEKTDSINIRDDTLTFGLTYYQTATGNNYIHLPRKWWYDSRQTSAEQWLNNDNTFNGQTLFDYTIQGDKFSFKSEFYTWDDGGGGVNTVRFNKPKNDNQRYTLMMRDKTYYTAENASGKLPGFFGDTGTEGVDFVGGRIRDPENAIYHTYKEVKNIVLPNGFSSPEFISAEVSRQFQEITNEKIYKQPHVSTNTPAGAITTPVPLFRTISTESYKPFNVANTFRPLLAANGDADFSVIENAFKEYYIEKGTSNNASGFDWLSQFALVGTKRPELYETGRLINEQFAGFTNTYTGIFGSKLKTPWLETEGFITIDVAYNKESVALWRDFFLAQELYPEVWQFFKETNNDYNDADTIENSRWFHMNRYNNASMTWTDQPAEAMLGDSYYAEHTWAADPVLPVHSVLVPLLYDSAQKDEFYEYSTTRSLIEDNKLSYGCITTNILGYIMFKTTPNNGIGSQLYTELKQLPDDTSIEAERKCGFDLHFTAPAMSYILPYAGYSQFVSSYKSPTNQGDYNLESIDHWAGNEIYGNVYNNKLYFGADAPELSWDGTNFSFSNLHTPLNKGNDNRVNNGVFPNVSVNNDASDVVYKINPKELLNDWTPARQPYILDDIVGSPASGGSFPVLNTNLEPWEIYDSSTGIFIQDFNLTESEWQGSLWQILGFSYSQFNSSVNSRLIKTNNKNTDSLYPITTNADIGPADSKIYVQNGWGVPLYNNMMPLATNHAADPQRKNYYPPIDQKTTSILIKALTVPTRMIRGYYTIRSNILSGAPFVGGKVNNTRMPIVGIVNKISNFGDFTFGEDSSLEFTTTKAMRLASVSCSIHDPDGSFARCGDQSTVLFKVQKNKNVTYNIVQEILQQNKGKF